MKKAPRISESLARIADALEKIADRPIADEIGKSINKVSALPKRLPRRGV